MQLNFKGQRLFFFSATVLMLIHLGKTLVAFYHFHIYISQNSLIFSAHEADLRPLIFEFNLNLLPFRYFSQIRADGSPPMKNPHT